MSEVVVMYRGMEAHRKVFLAGVDPPYVCCFCHEVITVLEGRTGDALVVHHADEDRSNNELSNLRAAHYSCHSRHHNTGRVVSAEARNSISANLTGRKLPEKQVAKMTATMRSKPRTCQPGCTCGRHKQHWKLRKTTGRPCPPGCTCRKHPRSLWEVSDVR